MAVYLGFLFCCIAVIVRVAEGTISGWSNPTIGTATGSAALTAISESSTGVLATVVATSDKTVTGYQIADQPTDGQLTIANTGAISLVCGYTLDFDTAPALVLKIAATDADGSITGTVTLTLTNVNEAPMFTYHQATIVVNDCLPAASSVITWLGVDPDSGDTVTCAIKSGNTNTDFAITAATGVIKVAAGKTLAASTLANYVLTITCNDDDATPLTSSATLTVCVGSVSNCPSGSGSGATAASVSLLAIVLFVFGTITMTE